MSLKFAALILPAFAIAVIAGPAWADGTNLVTNYNFTNSTASNTINSNMQMNTGGSSGVYDWTTTSGFAFIYTPSGSTGYSNTNSGSVPALVGPYGGSYSGFVPLSPTGGNFFAMDGDYPGGSGFTLSQTIGNLVNGASYTLSFWEAETQQISFSGQTTDQWTVSLGDKSATAAKVTVASQTFVGWAQVTMTFVADALSETLKFSLASTPAYPNNEPPFALLDGISLTQNTTTVPEPPAYALIAVALLGLVGIRRIYHARA